MHAKYKAPNSIFGKQTLYSHVLFLTAGTPVQFPSIRMLPGMEACCYVASIAVAADHIYIAKHPRPRISANLPGPGAIVFSSPVGTGGNQGPFNLDGDMLSQYWADADSAAQLVIIVYMNRSRDEQFV